MTAEATQTAPVDRRRILTAVAGLGATQIIGWGTTFSSLTIFGTRIGDDLALSREAVFGGITIMLLASALVAPRVGRFADQRGARPVMITGSLLAAMAMIALAFTQGATTYLLAWVLVGLAMPMMLANTALVGLVQIVGSNARQAITGLMLLSGLTGTVFLPLNALLIESIGWRNAYLGFALLHLLVCVPIHALILTRRAPEAPHAPRSSSDRAVDGILPPDKRFMAFVMLTVWSCAEGLIVWGLYMQIIDVFKGMGLSAVAAVGVWAAVGPAQASARFGELMLGGRYSILTTALLSAGLSCSSFFLILPFGGSIVTAAAFAICLGLGHGFYAIARNTLPLTLFGVREYGTYLGRMMLPQSIVNAIAPIVFATMIARFDPTSALWLAGAAALAGFASVVMLVRTCRT
ncbi:MFS transporter [Hyphomicrobium sp. CS1BSMeth3]|uniref:MFS transporter n=1 Tax=Hyphomicrobium sp. CS1BSMeth3 TaxID=1892844 RepID=UPI00092FE366|nr:MFS transporter [Hyphomicrobium sp. CS1BSMeth3]